MRKFLSSPKPLILFLFFVGIFSVGAIILPAAVSAQTTRAVQVSQPEIGFIIPDFADILTFLVRAFFVIAGLAALFYLLLGAFSWVTSGGDKDSIKAAQDKITAAVIGVILIVAVLAIVVTLETIVFQKRICFGVSCPASIPGLLSKCLPNPQYVRDPTQPKCCSNPDYGIGYENSDSVGKPEELKCCSAINSRIGDTDGDQICN